MACAYPWGSRADLDHISNFIDWGKANSNADAVPSVISYPRASADIETQWGYDNKPGSIVMTHTKLALDVQDSISELKLILQSLDGMNNLTFEYIESPRGRPQYPIFSPIEIVTHYLSNVFRHVAEDFSLLGRLILLIAVDVVIAVPPVGSPNFWL